MEESPIRSSIFSLPIEAIKYEDILSFCDKQMEEGVDLDYKADWPNDLEKVICSFANTQGGIALIGVQEEGKTRRPKCPPEGIVGAIDVLRQKVLNLSFDAIFPPIVPEIVICQLPYQSDHFVVMVRVNPSSLMHAVERRTRIYIRSEDSSRGYTLASLPDLHWLFDQRQKSLSLRETLQHRARSRADSEAIEFTSDESLRKWRALPLLTISILPTFPSTQTLINLRDLFGVVTSLDVMNSLWPNVSFCIPWNKSAWRSISDGMCTSLRGHSSSMEYIELGSHCQTFFAYSIKPISSKDISSQIEKDVPTLLARDILGYIELSLKFASAFYSALNLRWPLTMQVSIERIGGTSLYYILNPDYRNRHLIGLPSPDMSLNLLDCEINADEITTHLNETIQEAAQRLLWAYGVAWDKDKLEEWLSSLEGRMLA